MGSKLLLPFVSGFIVALAVVVPVFLIVYRKHTTSLRSRHDRDRKEFEELSKLTGGLAHEIKNPLSTIKINLKLISEDADTAQAKSSRWINKITVIQKETERLEQIP